MRQRNWKTIGLALLVLAVAIPMPHAAAFTKSVRLGDVEVSAFAPDWIWQSREANILFVVRNEGAAEATAEVTLHLPEGEEDHFAYQGETSQTLTVTPGDQVRGAFTGVLAKDGVPCQTYGLRIGLVVNGGTKTLDYPLKTIRGAVVGTSAAAIALPVVISFAFTLVFAWVLNSMAERGAWRIKGAPVTASEDRPEWIDETPT